MKSTNPACRRLPLWGVSIAVQCRKSKSHSNLTIKGERIWQRKSSPAPTRKPQRTTSMTRRDSRSWRAWRLCASGPACISALRRAAACHHLVSGRRGQRHRRGAGRATAPTSRCEISRGNTITAGRTTAAASPWISGRKTGLPAVTVVYTVLHAGGKFGGGRLQGRRRPARRGRLGGQRPAPSG